jgi:hypothetical protein
VYRCFGIVRRSLVAPLAFDPASFVLYLAAILGSALAAEQIGPRAFGLWVAMRYDRPYRTDHYEGMIWGLALLLGVLTFWALYFGAEFSIWITGKL